MDVSDRIQRQAKVHNLVYEALKNDSRCRDDDLWLILTIWRYQGKKVYVDYRDMRSMVKPESITRARRKIQNTDGLYCGSQKENRQDQEIAMRLFYKNGVEK